MTVGFSVVTLILLLASTAMACTVFRGTMIVTPLAAGSGVSQATGNNKSMAYCKGAPLTNAKIPITGDKVKVEVMASTFTNSTDCLTSSKLTGGTYTVNYASSGASDCMTVGGTGAPLGTFTVDSSNGAGSTTVTIPGISSHVANTIALCVTSTTTGLAEGNQVALTVI